MKNRKPRSPEDRLRDQLAAAKNTAETKDRIIAAQQSELEQMREVLRELSAPKPGRPFRTRRLIHGPLDVTIKGADVTEAEVVIEHVGGLLAIRIGDAIGAPQGAPPRYTREPEAPATNLAQPWFQPPPPMARDANDVRTIARDVYDASIAANAAINDGDPTVINARIAPQGDPRMPGAYQLHGEEAQIAATGYGGWNGVGPRPEGWEDPHAAKGEQAN